jgi:hypothetical protein
MAGLLQARPASSALRDTATDLVEFTGFSPAHWKKIWSINPVRHEAPCDRAEMEGLRLRVVAAA